MRLTLPAIMTVTGLVLAGVLSAELKSGAPQYDVGAGDPETSDSRLEGRGTAAPGGPGSLGPTPGSGPGTNTAGRIALLDLPALDSLSATRERPLFYKDRRHPEPEAEAPAPTEPEKAPEPTPVAPPLGTINLSAIVIDGTGQPQALMIDPESGKPRSFRVGETLKEGWLVEQITADSVFISNGADAPTEVALRDYDTPAPAPRPAGRAGAAKGNNRAAAARADARKRALARARNKVRNKAKAPRNTVAGRTASRRQTQTGANRTGAGTQRGRGASGAGSNSADRAGTNRQARTTPSSPSGGAQNCGLSRC